MAGGQPPRGTRHRRGRRQPHGPLREDRHGQRAPGQERRAVSGGRDAYRRVKGRDGIPAREYLFDADQNIELGSHYLALLPDDTAISRITNPVAREYCAIAAYTTGAGNVFRAFGTARGKARQEEAVARLNAMTPTEVHDTLRTRLPHEETRHDIVKAVDAKKRYAAM